MMGLMDCQIASFGQREDDNGNLDIYFPLDELKTCEDDLANKFRVQHIAHRGSRQ